MVGGQNPGPEAPPKSKRGGSKGDVRERAMEKSGCVRVIEGEEFKGDDQVKYSPPRRSEVSLESQRGSWQLKSPGMKRFMQEKRNRFCRPSERSK